MDQAIIDKVHEIHSLRDRFIVSVYAQVLARQLEKLIPDPLAGDVGLYLLRRPDPRFGFSPIKLFEYMAAARPVLVGTDLPEIREFVRKHEIGEASDLDPGRIAAAAGRLLQDADARRRMGENGRRLVKEQFNWDRSVADLEKVLMSCASR